MAREIVLSHRASLRDVGRKSYDDLLEIAKSRAPDPTVFETRDVAFWGAEISNNTLDSYYTSMAPSFLKEQVRFLDEGISYQDSHNWFQLGDGQSLAGSLHVDEDREVEEVGQPYTRVEGIFYTLRDLTLNGRNTNELIDAMRAGVTRDVSIGFSSEDITCSICGRQMFEIDWEDTDNNCPHMPGFRYDEEKRLAWGSVNSGRLNETSGVFDGSNLTTQINFVIQKAEELMETRGPLDDKVIRSLESRYQTRVRVPQKLYSVGERKMGVRTEVETNLRLTDEQIETLKGFGYEGDLSVDDLGEALLSLYAENESLRDQLDSVTGEEGELDSDVDDLRSEVKEAQEKLDAAMEVLEETQGKLAAAEEEVRNTKPYVEMGKKYRTSLIGEALAAGVRSQGNDFKKDQWEKVMSGMDIDAIELTRDTFVADFEKSNTVRPPVTRGLGDKSEGENFQRKSSRRAGYKG